MIHLLQYIRSCAGRAHSGDACAVSHQRTRRDDPSAGLNHAELAAWAKAATLADVGELTTRWAEGDVLYHPNGYDEGPAEETRELISALATLNRSGFITSSSQPGLGPVRGADGMMWSQRAAVDDFTDKATADRLEITCPAAGLIVIRNGPARWRTSYKNSVIVTAAQASGDPITDDSAYDAYTRFGIHLSRRDVRFEFDGYAADALLAAEQITVIDPEWGRPDLLWSPSPRA